MQEKEREIPVALLHDSCLGEQSLEDCVERLLRAAEIPLAPQEHILIKPNLLRALPLACTGTDLVAACCRVLLDWGCRVTVSDSPGFGRGASVAASVGLLEALQRLHLSFEPMGPAVWRSFRVRERTVRLPVSRLALESSRILSMPRIKAHSQMLLTMAVKNCYGCIPGLYKAVLHTLYGKDPAFFADVVAGLWSLLPPVSALCDGRIMMHVTGPGGGSPYALHLLGASVSAVALDEVLCSVLHREISSVPLAAALERRGAEGCQKSGWGVRFPLDDPARFPCADVQLPETLLTTSFAPHRLIVSLMKRVLAQVRM